jgi:hypothetical protein
LNGIQEVRGSIPLISTRLRTSQSEIFETIAFVKLVVDSDAGPEIHEMLQPPWT